MERITEQSEWREYFYHECCEYTEFRDETDRRPQLKKCPYCKSEAIERQSGREDPVTFFFIEDYFCKQCNKVRSDCMLLHLDFASDIPIYLQIRNQVVLGIAEGKLQIGEKLPTIRALSEECGINMMTVSKAYQLLNRKATFKLTDVPVLLSAII